ncbi:MAG TPA: class I SAM-dependent methyltransferase [Nanoarchaeota archaeon]|nr:class I SAM-dependent methyltransferase [Nanoarchaeota archaeon]
MEEHVRCNLCKSDDYNILFPKIEVSRIVPITDKYSAAKSMLCTDQIVKCRKCGLVYINPRIKSDIIIDATSRGDDKNYVSQGVGRMLTFENELKWMAKHAPKGKLLDVGCASGFFLKVAKDAGWDVMGVEPNRWLAEYGKNNFGLNIKAGTLEGAKFRNNSFDVICMWDVIEHMPDPNHALGEANRILNKGGILIVSTPDYGSILAGVFGRKWWFLLSHHLFYFTAKTMRKILEQNGFRVKIRKMHWQKLSLQYMLDMVKHLNKENKVVLFGHRWGSAIFKALKIGNIQIPYYAAQMDLIAVKK